MLTVGLKKNVFSFARLWFLGFISQTLHLIIFRKVAVIM